MAKKDLFDSINIPEPCPQSWDAMVGDDKARFCANCEKDIYNLSEMTRREAKKLLLQSKTNVCVRLEKEADGKVKTLKKQFHQITRQIPIAAGVLSASLAFAAVADAQTKPPPRPPIGKVKPPLVKILVAQSTASISGTVTDVLGAVIPNAQIVLFDAKNKPVHKTESNDDGFYELKNIKPGIYNLEIKARFFKKSVQRRLKLNADEKKELIVELDAEAGSATLGVLTSVEPLEIGETQVSDKIQTRQIESLPVSNRKEFPVLGLFPAAESKPETKNNRRKAKSKN